MENKNLGHREPPINKRAGIILKYYSLVKLGEDNGTVWGKVDGLFEHGGERAILGGEGPAIGVFDQVVVTHGGHNLDGESLVDT